MRFQDKTVIVTGAAGGIGAAICTRFGSEGAQVVVTDVNAEGARVVIHYGATAMRPRRGWPIWAGAAGACPPICQTRKERGLCGQLPWGWQGGSPAWSIMQASAAKWP